MKFNRVSDRNLVTHILNTLKLRHSEEQVIQMVHLVSTQRESPEISKVFRKTILDQCQKEFQEGNSEEQKLKSLEIEYNDAPEDKKESIKLEMEERKLNTPRRRRIANVRFIGELHKLNMLEPKIIVECVGMLMSNQDEESYDYLCKLLTENVVTQKLPKDSNVWKPSFLSNRKNVEEIKDSETIIEDIKKRTLCILNKLTTKNFDKLVQKFAGMKFESNIERIGAAVGIFCKKAIDDDQPWCSFLPLYAKMVHYICTHQKSPENSKMFRKKILDQCQKEFQEGNSEEEKLKSLEIEYNDAPDGKKESIKLEMEEQKLNARRRSIGNIRFIGELFKLNMLTPKIMVECIDILTCNNPDEESYECLCKLLTTIGQKLEIQLEDLFSKKTDKPKWTPKDKYMDNLFKKLKKLTEDTSISFRIRFALLDVYELRDSGWKPRRDANAPPIINEIPRATIVKNEWSSKGSNNVSRFQQAKKPVSEPSGVVPKFVPSTPWARPFGGTSSGYGAPLKNLPPRLQPGPSRFNARSSSEANPPPREDIVQQLTPDCLPSLYSELFRPHTPTRETDSNSMPFSQSGFTSPQDSSTKDMLNFDAKEEVKKLVKNFLEYSSGSS